MEISRVSIDALIPDPSNARMHDEVNISAIKGSLAKFGQQKPIVITKNNVVVAGNGTLEAAKALGWTELDVIYSELSGTEAIAYALSDNRTAELGSWNKDILGKQLLGLSREGFGIASIGFDPKQWIRSGSGKDDETILNPTLEDPKKSKEKNNGVKTVNLTFTSETADEFSSLIEYFQKLLNINNVTDTVVEVLRIAKDAS